MKKNIGTVDRVFRVIVGLGLIAFGIIYHNWFGALGAVPLLTALIGFCPLYCPFGINTTGKGGSCCGGKCG